MKATPTGSTPSRTKAGSSTTATASPSATSAWTSSTRPATRRNTSPSSSPTAPPPTGRSPPPPATSSSWATSAGPTCSRRPRRWPARWRAGARTLWRSLRAFDAQEDWLQIWPGHGAGSACGKGISAIPYSTLGYERRFNWAFAVKTEDEFVARVLEGQPDPPAYFATMKALNKRGPELRRTSLPPRLDGDRLLPLVQAGARSSTRARPTRSPSAHVPGTLNMPAGALVRDVGRLAAALRRRSVSHRARRRRRAPSRSSCGSSRSSASTAWPASSTPEAVHAGRGRRRGRWHRAADDRRRQLAAHLARRRRATCSTCATTPNGAAATSPAPRTSRSAI